MFIFSIARKQRLHVYFQHRQKTKITRLFSASPENVKITRLFSASPENVSGGSPSFWSYGVSPMDCTNVLKKYQYQVAAFSPQPHVTKSSHSDLSMLAGSDEVGILPLLEGECNVAQ